MSDNRKRFVRMFQHRFAPLVEAGTKLQTVRPTPKRMPQAGDVISLRCWEGKPYRSKQRVLREAVIDRVVRVLIQERGLSLRSLNGDWGRFTDSRTKLDAFAREDGFENWKALAGWFSETHALPFDGILICWAPIKGAVDNAGSILETNEKAFYPSSPGWWWAKAADGSLIPVNVERRGPRQILSVCIPQCSTHCKKWWRPLKGIKGKWMGPVADVRQGGLHE